MFEPSGAEISRAAVVEALALSASLAMSVGCSADGMPYLDSGAASDALACDVAIVGGGAGGVHTAYRLTNPPGAPPAGVSNADKVCLFEKNAYLGGRIEDVQFGPNSTASGWSNAAYLSSIRVLNAHFDMGLDPHALEPIVCGG